MAATGGPVESITLNARYFAVAGDSDPARGLGGKKNSIEMNGDDSFRPIQEAVPSKVGPMAVNIDDDKNDQEFIQDLIDTGEELDFSITYVTGVTYYAAGTITEDVEASAKSATMEITFQGGKLRQQ